MGYGDTIRNSLMSTHKLIIDSWITLHNLAMKGLILAGYVKSDKDN